MRTSVAHVDLALAVVSKLLLQSDNPDDCTLPIFLLFVNGGFAMKVSVSENLYLGVFTAAFEDITGLPCPSVIFSECKHAESRAILFSPSSKNSSFNHEWLDASPSRTTISMSGLSDSLD